MKKKMFHEKKIYNNFNFSVLQHSLQNFVFSSFNALIILKLPYFGKKVHEKWKFY